MDQYIIDNYYSKVGSSFYKSTDFYDLKSQTNAEFNPTSRFGIGILSSFMVADTLIVDTRRVVGAHESSEPLNITVEGQDSIFCIKKGDRTVPGTTTKLMLRDSQNPWNGMSDQEFIKSVADIVPKPPFRMNIISSSESLVIDENTFKNFNAHNLKDHTWVSHENIRYIDINIDYPEMGVSGSAIIALLETQGYPVNQINTTSKPIFIEGNHYNLNKTLSWGDNTISSTSHSITVSDTGAISDYGYVNNLASSKSKLSLHGIEVPTTLFPESWAVKHNQVRVSWPFPLIVVMDVGGKRDLDLNSSRTEVIMSDNWLFFEEDLAYIICKDLKQKLSESYWSALKSIFEVRTTNQQFIKGLKRADEAA